MVGEAEAVVLRLYARELHVRREDEAVDHVVLRGVALGRKSWLFAGSERGGDRAAFMYTLIVTAKMNDIDPQAWLADVLARIAATQQSQLSELLPWHWRRTTVEHRSAA